MATKYTLIKPFQAAFEVRGTPRGQPRPRAFARKIGGRYQARVHDPGTAEGWKSAVVMAGAPHRPTEPLEQAVKIYVQFRLPRPKRLMRKKDPGGLVPHTATPDLDNLLKAVMDALTQDGWWRDDAQVHELRGTKNYHEKNDAPGAWVYVSAWRGDIEGTGLLPTEPRR